MVFSLFTWQLVKMLSNNYKPEFVLYGTNFNFQNSFTRLSMEM